MFSKKQDKMSASQLASIKQFLLKGDRLSQASTCSISSQMSDQKSTNKEQPLEKKKQKMKFEWSVYKKLMQYTINQWPMALIGFSFTMISGLLSSLIPWQIGETLDFITSAKGQTDKTNFHAIILFLTLIMLSYSFVSIIRYVFMRLLQQKISIDMRTDIYSKFLKNDMKFFQQYKTGEFVSRLSGDINQAKSAISSNLTTLMNSIVTVIGNIVMLVFINPKLSVIVLILVPLFLLITYIFTRKNKVLVRQYRAIAAEMSAHIAQKISAINIVKAYNMEDGETINFRAINQKGYNVNKKKVFYGAAYEIFTQFLPKIATIFVLLAGGTLILEHSQGLTSGQLTSFILYCTAVTSNTKSLSKSYASIINGTQSIQKVFEMLEYEPQINEDSSCGTNDIQITNGDIQFVDVNFKYPRSQVPILQNINLKIKQGQFIGVVGQSGSGKSSIIKVLERFYKIKSGSIYIGGKNIEQISNKNIRKQIGLVSQEDTLFSGTIEQNIAYGMQRYTKEDLQSVAKKAGCWEFIMNKNMFPKGFDTIIGEKGNTLSGGQRQRIAIARALIRKPKIIIFDQATSALDTNSQRLVQESIEKIATSDRQITIIVIAHRLSTILNADEIIVLDKGKIVQQGNHKALLQNKAAYYKLVQQQLHGHLQTKSPGPQRRAYYINKRQSTQSSQDK